MRNPSALRLARSRQRSLVEQASVVSSGLIAQGKGNVLRGFRALLTEGRASINMSMLKLIRFLRTGRWLNIYEAVARETGLSGAPLVEEVVRRLREYGDLRLSIDRLLRFPRDTHYASLNLGGPGPFAEYGICCVVFDLHHWAPLFTCFAGDSIHACFDAQGGMVLREDELLARFAAGEDLAQLALVRYEGFLQDHRFCLEVTRARRLFESGARLIELHLFGEISRSQIAEVRIPHGKYEELCDLMRGLEREPHSTAQEMDQAKVFRELLVALEHHDVPLVVCGDS